jgi:hypothetical protein
VASEGDGLPIVAEMSAFRTFGRFTLLLRSRSLQFFDAEQILFPTAGELVADEVLTGNDGNPDFSLDGCFLAVLPGLVKGDSVDLPEDIDSARGIANLEAAAVPKIDW